MSLFQQQDRERLFSEAVATESRAGLGLDPRPAALLAARGFQVQGSRPVKAWRIWVAALIAFIIADVVALIATRV